MVTDGILKAVEKIIEHFENQNEVYAGEVIWNMLSEFDEDKWYQMDEKQKQKWIEKFI